MNDHEPTLEYFPLKPTGFAIRYTFPGQPERELEIFTCTVCLGEFGVDAEYIDQTSSDHVSCPICGTKKSLEMA